MTDARSAVTTTPRHSTQEQTEITRVQHTLDALHSYNTPDPVEEAFRQRMLALITVDGDPFSRRWESPGHFTASAFVLSPDEAQVLLIRHRKLQRWLQPGGHFEPDDVDVEAATRREVAEETGLSAMTPLHEGLFDVDVHAIPAHGDDVAHAHFDLRMAYRAETWSLSDTDEVDDVRWVPLADVAHMETDASVLRAVGRLILRLREGRGGEIIG